MTTMTSDHSDLLRGMALYTAALVTAMVGFHAVVVLIGDGMVDQWGFLALAIAAAVIVIGATALRRPLTTRPFAFFVFHVVSYVCVAGSVSVHAFLTDWTGGWGGGLVWMVALWSVGLLVHAFASIARGGFADAHP